MNTDPDYAESYGHDLRKPPGFVVVQEGGRAPSSHRRPSRKTGRAPELQAAAPDGWFELSVPDAASLGVAERDVVRVESPRGAMQGRARISGLRQGVVLAPVHEGSWDG